MLIRLRARQKHALRFVVAGVLLTSVFYLFLNSEAPFAESNHDLVKLSHLKYIDKNVNIGIYISTPSGDIIEGSKKKKNETKDWENYEQIARDSIRIGPGEQGSAVVLSPDQKKISNKTKTLNGFSIFVSDMISIDRSVKDLRNAKCKGRLYMKNLPSVSVVLPVFEEHWKTLLRTIYSTIRRAPAELIKEIILVDDGSSRSYLKEQLDNYMKENFTSGFVKVVHLNQRQGLIQARVEGAKVATGDVILFLDSHCEVGTNWLPPLLEPIVLDYKTVTCPLIDIIDAETFEYVLQDDGARGVFDWEFGYQRIPKLPQDASRPDVPFPSPVMAGGLFAISRKWFWELGGYDPNLQIWGGEQYELSFKIWMCGGKLLDIPCSRIGHVYRGAPTSFPEPNLGNFVGRNFKRIAEVWMDDYKEYVYLRHPEFRALDIGDLSDRHAIRKRLNCKSFKWFLEEVAPDLTKVYPVIDPIPSATGKIRPLTHPNLCIDAKGSGMSDRVNLEECTGNRGDSHRVQKFQLTFHGDIRPVKKGDCFDVPNAKPREPVVLFPCHNQHGNQHFEIHFASNPKANPIILRHVTTNYCIDFDTQNFTLFVNPCDALSKTQQWQWDTLQIDEAAESRRKAGLEF